MDAPPFDPSRLPADLRAVWDRGDRAAFEVAAKARVERGDADPETIVAYAWAFIQEAEAMLAFEEPAFFADCMAVLEWVDPIYDRPELSDPEGARALLSRLVYAYKDAQARRG